jgi:hypothetical protein
MESRTNGLIKSLGKSQTNYEGVSPSEAIAKRIADISNEMLEAYAAAYLKFTGHDPDKVHLVQRTREDGSISFRFELIAPDPTA